MSDNETSASKHAKQAAEDLRAEFAALRDDVNAILKTLKTASTEVAGDAKSAAGHAAQGIKRVAADKFEDVRDRAETLEEDLVRNVKESPIQSLAIAFGVGFALSLLMRR